jgi:DNA modification methylase
VNKTYLHDIKSGLPFSYEVNCVVTSPPYYGLRDYGESEQIGLERSPNGYIESLCDVFSNIKKQLSPDGNVFVNIGDSYFSKPKSNKDRSGLQGTSYGNNDSAHGYKNMGEKYKGLKDSEPYLTDKQLLLIPHRFAIEMQNRGWILRNTIIWHKPNFKPDPVRDRLANAHEYIFHFVKSKRYYYDLDAIRLPKQTQDTEDKKAYARMSKRIEESTLNETEKELATNELKRHYESGRINNDARLKLRGEAKSLFGDNVELSGRAKELKDKGFCFHCNNPRGKNRGDVLSINVKAFKDAHFAVYPEELIVPLILAGCPEGGIVFDPFMGAGTTALVAQKLGRNYVGTELNSEYIEIANKRLDALAVDVV